jgi:hypothetical protein
VLGRPLEARRGADRKSVRIPNLAWRDGSGKPKTIVRKVTVPDAIPHRDIAGWPHAFRPAGWYAGDQPIYVSTY